MAFKIIPKGPWSRTIDWNLLATINGETRQTFYHHVKAEQPGTILSNHGFPQFMRLPLELQRHTFTFCDDASLFQLMHVSFAIRDEAKKLFWSGSTARYHVHGNWLLSGGYAANACHDLGSLACMQHIEVDFEVYPSVLYAEWEEGELTCLVGKTELAQDHANRQIAKFWSTLRRRFPAAVDVVLSTDCGSVNVGGPAPFELTQLAEGCPSDITVTVSSLRRTQSLSRYSTSRHIWKKICQDSCASSWTLVDPAWTRQSILPPPKKFLGPVGSYVRLLNNEAKYMYLFWAHRLQMIQATEAYYLHVQPGPCVCPVTECGQRFGIPGQWTAHFLKAGHNAQELCLPPCEQLRDLFKLHDASLALLGHTIASTRTSMRAAWDKEGSQQRKDVSRAFLQQLHHDPIYEGEMTPEDSSLWLDYQWDMGYEWRG